MSEKKAVIIGASTGIGRALAKVFAQNGYELGLASRRIELLKELQIELSSKMHILQLDVTEYEKASESLKDLINKMDGVDIIVINSGIRISNAQFSLEPEIDTIETNVIGFAAMANTALKYFINKKSGSLVAISSIAGLRGSGNSPSYNASKAFIINYMEGLCQKITGTSINITDIRPGFVQTDMIKDVRTKFWVSTPEKAAKQIYSAILKKKKVAYVTRRWFFVALIARIIPKSLYAVLYRFVRRENNFI